MNVMPVSSPYAPELPQYSAAHMHNVARRRWAAQREQERKLRRQQGATTATERVARIRQPRPDRSTANPLSPVYSLFNEAFLRGR